MAAMAGEDYRPTTEALALYDDFLARTSADRLQKILARYELFKMVLEVPGDIVECGVYKGSGIYTFAKIHKLLRPNNERKIVGFDFFETAREVGFKHVIDTQVLDEHDRPASRAEILANLKAMGVNNVQLVAGSAEKAIGEYVKQNVGFRASLLYVDFDNYEGTMAALTHLYPLVVTGGIVAFDEYAMAGFGESDGVDDYFRERREPVRLRSFPWANTPTAWMRKGEVP
jgi:hypothetical protein